MDIIDIAMAKKLSGGGGGGTLPTPTASNVGAALVVVKQKNSGAVIVPEQTLTLEDGGGVPENSNKSLFTVGTEVIAVINGVECIGVVEENDDRVLVAFDYRYGFSIIDDNLVFFDGDLGESATIKLNVLETNYGYALDKYAGYDIVVETAYSDNTLSHYTPLKWDYPTIHNKVLNGEAVTGILCYHYNYDVDIDGDTNIDIFPLTETNINHNDGRIIFKGFGGTTGKLIYTIIFDTAGEWSSVSKGTWS